MDSTLAQRGSKASRAGTGDCMPHRLRAAALAATLTAAGSLAGAATASAAKLQMPFKCGVSVYGEARANHDPSNAIDFNGLGGGDTDLGMPVLAAGPGRITISTYYKTNGYGNAVEIDHGDGRRTFYAHLRSRRYAVGTVVKRGQRIGRLGKSSAKYTFSAHLHYEMRRGGSAVQAWFNGHPAPVYSHMEQSVKMTSRNCKKKKKAAPAPQPQPQPQPQPAAPAPAAARSGPRRRPAQHVLPARGRGPHRQRARRRRPQGPAHRGREGQRLPQRRQGQDRLPDARRARDRQVRHLEPVGSDRDRQRARRVRDRHVRVHRLRRPRRAGLPLGPGERARQPPEDPFQRLLAVGVIGVDERQHGDRDALVAAGEERDLVIHQAAP